MAHLEPCLLQGNTSAEASHSLQQWGLSTAGETVASRPLQGVTAETSVHGFLSSGLMGLTRTRPLAGRPEE